MKASSLVKDLRAMSEALENAAQVVGYDDDREVSGELAEGVLNRLQELFDEGEFYR